MLSKILWGDWELERERSMIVPGECGGLGFMCWLIPIRDRVGESARESWGDAEAAGSTSTGVGMGAVNEECDARVRLSRRRCG